MIASFFRKRHSPTTVPPIEFGVTGLKHRNGTLSEEFLPELRGVQGRKLYAEMRDNDPTIGALLSAMELMLRAVQWRFDARPEDTDQHGVRWMQQAWTQLQIPWNETIAEMTQAFVFGFGLFEVVFQPLPDGTIGIKKLAPRAADTIISWEFDASGEWQAALQRDPNSGKTLRLPRERMILVCPNYRHHNPEGRSVLRNAYTSYYHLKRLQAIEAIAIERELNGLPVVYAPSQALKDSATKDKLDQIARDLKFNEQGGVVIPSDLFTDRNGGMSQIRQFEVKLLASEGTRAIDTSAVIQRYQQDMLRAVLADFLMLGSGKTGSYALAVTKSDLFLRSLEAYVEHIRSLIQQHVIEALWRLNGFDRRTMPQLVASSVRPVNLDDLSDYITALSGAGVQLNDTETENYLRQLGNLPQAKEK